MRQCKQAITVALLDDGDGDALVIGNSVKNGRLVKELLPHVSWRVTEWIADCLRLRQGFYNGQSGSVCKSYEDLHRESLAIHI